MSERQDLSYELCEILLGFVDDAQKSCLQQQIEALLNKYCVTKKEGKKLPDVQKHITHFLAAKKVDDIRGYIVHLTEQRRLKEGSVQTHTNTLRSFFSWLLVEGVIRKNPMLKIRSQKIDKKHLRQALFMASRQPYGRINSRSVQYLIQKGRIATSTAPPSVEAYLCHLRLKRRNGHYCYSNIARPFGNRVHSDLRVGQPNNRVLRI